MRTVMLKNVLLAFALAVGISLSAQVQEGEMAPDFTYKDTGGKDFTLSEHRGKVVFVFLFGNGCPYCIAIGNKTETDIHQAFKSDEDFVAVGLDLWDGTSSPASVSSFRSQTSITYPLLVKAGGVGSSYGITYDRLMVIDKEGILRHKGTTNTSNDIQNAKKVIQEYLVTSGAADLEAGKESLEPHFYPNPTRGNGSLFFHLNEPGKVCVSVFNNLGQVILSREDLFGTGTNEFRLEMPGGAKGLYFYRIETEQGRQATGRIVVN